ncbi:MAG: hypothetical protein K8S97_11170 [Anaerolineae bacterium]|nr:hypothetical protein [Anaerolineae bacterium]
MTDSTQTDLKPVPASFPTSLDPYEMLEILHDEFRTPLAALIGWSQVINNDPNLEDVSFEAAAALISIARFLQEFMGTTEAYLAAWQAAREE